MCTVALAAFNVAVPIAYAIGNLLYRQHQLENCIGKYVKG